MLNKKALYDFLVVGVNKKAMKHAGADGEFFLGTKQMENRIKHVYIIYQDLYACMCSLFFWLMYWFYG